MAIFHGSVEAACHRADIFAAVFRALRFNQAVSHGKVADLSVRTHIAEKSGVVRLIIRSGGGNIKSAYGVARSVERSGIGYFIVVCINIAARSPLIKRRFIGYIYILVYGNIRRKRCGIGQLTVFIEPHKLIRRTD